ncbi:GFA family protein [Luteimonas sp. SDU82]|uniref:GFA family protein n=1 Tax=Luteimonas sp. SDU82 TaxID=3422592 RepID=UPI003EBB0263
MACLESRWRAGTGATACWTTDRSPAGRYAGGSARGEECTAAMIAGRCLCGAVQYRSPGPALFSIVCHCRDCQRATGSGGVPVLGVPRSSFTCSGPVRQWHMSGGSGQAAVRNFCEQCGSMLFGTPESAPEMVTIYAGSPRRVRRRSRRPTRCS